MPLPNEDELEPGKYCISNYKYALQPTFVRIYYDTLEQQEIHKGSLASY